MLGGQFNVDVLNGGAGNDSYTGSTTDWNGDRITDYEYGEKILVAFGSPSAQFYQLRHSATDTFIDLDTNHNGVFNDGGDSSIVLSGVIDGTLSVSAYTDPVYAQLVITSNHAPIAPAAFSSGDEDTLIAGTVLATDADNDLLTYELVQGARDSNGDPVAGLTFNSDGATVSKDRRTSTVL